MIVSMVKKFAHKLENWFHFFWSYFFAYPLLYVICFLEGESKKKPFHKPRLVWGNTPILNFKYLSQSLKILDYDSKTFMKEHYQINKRSDFDLYPEDIFDIYAIPFLYKVPFLKRCLKIFQSYFCFVYSLKRFDIFHISFDGFFLSDTYLKKFEANLLKLANKKVVVLGYGSDYYRYSLVNDVSLRHALMISYPNSGRFEKKVKEKFDYWVTNADFIVGVVSVADGWSRWDVLPCNYIVIDTNEWNVVDRYNDNDGYNGEVRLTHTPNHRGFKGTEFIIKVVNELKEEGIKVHLNLLERQPNETVKKILREETDILVEQLIFVGYALSAIEGMATGLPVISNLSNEYYTRVLRRYSFLNECPIVSANPETIKGVLKKLITNPSLRKELGALSRKYVEKYHSFKTSQYLFGKVYDKIWYKKDVDLINLYNPNVETSYNHTSEFIKTPLVDNLLI